MEKAIDSEVSIELTVDASGSTCKEKKHVKQAKPSPPSQKCRATRTGTWTTARWRRAQACASGFREPGCSTRSGGGVDRKKKIITK